jgi:hypothetical protein
MGLIVCPEMLVTNYLSTLCNIPEEQIFHLHYGRGLKSHIFWTLKGSLFLIGKTQKDRKCNLSSQWMLRLCHCANVYVVIFLGYAYSYSSLHCVSFVHCWFLYWFSDNSLISVFLWSINIQSANMFWCWKLFRSFFVTALAFCVLMCRWIHSHVKVFFVIKRRKFPLGIFFQLYYGLIFTLLAFHTCVSHDLRLSAACWPQIT